MVGRAPDYKTVFFGLRLLKVTNYRDFLFKQKTNTFSNGQYLPTIKYKLRDEEKSFESKCLTRTYIYKKSYTS